MQTISSLKYKAEFILTWSTLRVSLSDYIYIIFNVIAFFITTLFPLLCKILTYITHICEKHFPDHIIPQTVYVWAHKTNLTPKWLYLARKERGHVYCVSDIDFEPFYDFLLDFRTVLTVWYFRTVLTVWYFRNVLTVLYFFFFILLYLV